MVRSDRKWEDEVEEKQKRNGNQRRGTEDDTGNSRRVWEGCVVGIVEIGWDRGGKGFLGELVGLEAVEDIVVELVGIDMCPSLILSNLVYIPTKWTEGGVAEIAEIAEGT